MPWLADRVHLLRDVRQTTLPSVDIAGLLVVAPRPAYGPRPPRLKTALLDAVS